MSVLIRVFVSPFKKFRYFPSVIYTFTTEKRRYFGDERGEEAQPFKDHACCQLPPPLLLLLQRQHHNCASPPPAALKQAIKPLE
jgi:hypothetical protein